MLLKKDGLDDTNLFISGHKFMSPKKAESQKIATSGI